MRCTIDASVFVASARSDEPKYLHSRRFLREIFSQEIYCLTLVLPECAAAISRQTNNPSLAQELVSIIEDLPGINLISLDRSLARRAKNQKIYHKLE